MKQKNILRLISLLLVSASICTAVACNKEDFTEDGTDTAQVSDTAETEVTLVSDGESDYRLLWRSRAGETEKAAAMDLADYISEVTGVTLKLETEFTADGGNGYEKTIFVGRVDIEEVKPMWQSLGENDYSVSVKDGNIYILGGSPQAVYCAMRHFKNKFVDAENKTVTISADYSYLSEGADGRDDYVEHPDSLIMPWIAEFETPSGMLDFEEKREALSDPDGRFMTLAHRGDAAHFPENSIEGIISAYQMGVDICEVDVRASKDGVPVLMHDDNLIRMTNYSDVAGTVVNEITLPTSSKIADWTFEQLRCLRLKEGSGGDGAKLTDYVIPTLEEAVKVAKGRMYLLCDKLNTTDDVKDIAWPVFKRYEAYDTMIYCGSISISDAYQLNKSLAKETGGATPHYMGRISVSNSSKWVSSVNTMKTANMTMFIRFSGWSTTVTDLDGYLQDNREAILSISDKARLQADCYEYENAESFNKLADLGINVGFVNDPLICCKFVAEKYFNN